MSDLPAIADLLQTAREALLQQIRPQLAAEERYVAAMIARAMQLAVRELVMGGEMHEQERRALGHLPGAPDADLRELRHWLAAAIRRGEFDALSQELEAAFSDYVAARLAMVSAERD